ncbi:MAG: hypothetical protein IKV68_06025 [Oscillospiraceae bacterium]|nr:hypothetical protein [Oscillospiraceae bacterium]
MSKNKKKKYVKPLTRWAYFIKTLYNDPSTTTEFEFERHVYVKSEKLQQVDADNKRIHSLLLLALFATGLLAANIQNILIFLAYIFVVVAGEAVRFFNLPKDIQNHLTDTGRFKTR